MFPDKLSSSLLLLCGVNGLSYESASEKCGVSPRYFGRIVRKESSPTITVLENICTGFEKSPNELLGYPVLVKADMHSIPMAVVFTCCFHTCHGLMAYPVCPSCGCTLEREYQNYCDRYAKGWTGTDTTARPLSYPKVHICCLGWLSPAFLLCPFLCCTFSSFWA